jgi:hypothetical protein
MKKLQMIVALVGLLAIGAVAQADVLWDQSDYDAVGMQSWYDSQSGCAPFGMTVHSASDIHVWDFVTISKITTWYTPFNSGNGAATQAYLYITPKTGPLPIDGVDLPQENGTLITITATQSLVDGMWNIVAADLAISLAPGDYWVSLTPILPGGFFGPDTHLRALGSWGVPSTSYEYCGSSASTWAVLPEPLDLSILIEGSIDTVPTETTTWGEAKALFR